MLYYFIVNVIWFDVFIYLFNWHLHILKCDLSVPTQARVSKYILKFILQWITKWSSHLK